MWVLCVHLRRNAHISHTQLQEQSQSIKTILQLTNSKVAQQNVHPLCALSSSSPTYCTGGVRLVGT